MSATMSSRKVILAQATGFFIENVIGRTILQSVMRFLALLTVLGVVAACQSGAAEPVNPPAKIPFGVGEKLQYRIFWGPVPVGVASLAVMGIDQVDGYECYRVEGEARTVGLGRLLYRLNSRTTSWLDTTGLFSRRFEQDGREGRHVKRRITTYDYEQMEATTRDLVSGKEYTLPLDAPVQDIISAFYYIRSLPLAVDNTETLAINTGKKSWDVTIRPDKRRKLSLRPTGEREALRVEPDPTLLFVARNDGRMWFWISDDKQRLPLVMNSTMSIGSAKMVLFDIVPAATPSHPAAGAVLGAAQQR